MQDHERPDVVVARMFLHREVVTAEATRRLHQAKDRGLLVDIKPVTLDELNLPKVKGENPTDTEVVRR